MIQRHEDIDEPAKGVGEKDERELEALLDFLRRDRGFDFAGHKRPSLLRRVRSRMAVVGLSSLVEYREYLRLHEAELGQLFDLLLINVTGFFRDPPAWRAIAERLPSIIDPDPGAPIRVWSAACSSGEEPYTLVMVLREALGAEAFDRRVTIFATDIDQDALGRARLATYSKRAVESVPRALVDRYFAPLGGGFVFKKELGRDVVFGRHDLLKDAPIPRVDVLTCRNALMYFDADAQERILRRLRLAISPRGALLLGRAEMLLSHARLFVPLDLEVRLFAPSEPARPQRGPGRRVRPARVAARSIDDEDLAQALDASREELRGAREELETTREELEATREELEATREELEATREELEATNEELKTMNEELRQRGAELHEMTSLFGAVLASLRAGVADRELRALSWSSKMVSLFGARAHDLVGEPFADVAIGLPIQDLASSVRAAIETRQESDRTLNCVDTRGAIARCKVSVAPLRGEHTRAVIVLVEEVG